jgi:hypothetical protein
MNKVFYVTPLALRSRLRQQGRYLPSSFAHIGPPALQCRKIPCMDASGRILCLWALQPATAGQVLRMQEGKLFVPD